MPETAPNDVLRLEAQARLAAIVESSDDAIVSKNLDGVILSWNEGAQRIFGYTPDEIIGKSITILIPADRQHEEPMILSRLRAGQRIDHYETVRVTKDGRLIDVSVTISPMRNAAGELFAASKIARDITDQKRVQHELQHAKEQAEAASRAKDQFLSALSHELRTPLTPVLAAISFIESNPQLPPDELRGQVGMIRRNVEAEARLVDDLLDLTRISRGKLRLHFEVVDAHAVLRTALAAYQSEVDRKGLEVTVALRAKERHVWADAARLQQVFLNLLSNAVKFTPEGGAIAVRSSNPRDRELAFEISDTGIGLEPQFLPRMFNAFEQSEQTVTHAFGGLGLGLSIVKSILDLHHANVAAASPGRGRGATFTVEIATVSPAQEREPPAEEPSPEDEKPVFRILLVEDHADTRTVMARLLRSFGFAVSSAGSVKEALRLADTERFDLLVSDIGLPDGSGVDVMKTLKDRQGIRGIALSGFGQEDDIRRSRDAGFETHLTKPVDFHTLRQVIKQFSGSN
jgi:PAS domain S-box-containing protein